MYLQYYSMHFRITGDRTITRLRRIKDPGLLKEFPLDIRLIQNLNDELLDFLFRTGKIVCLEKLWAMK